VNPLHQRIFDIAFKHKVGHISSAITACDVLDQIYQTKKPEEQCFLSCGHCFLGLAVVIEKYEGHDAEAAFLRNGCHPHRDPAHGIHCSAGSLGLGICIAVGAALADRTKDVYVLISDGELDSGACLEALSFKRRVNLSNLKVYLNLNGRTTCRELDREEVMVRAYRADASMVIRDTSCDQYAPLRGIVGHYKVLSDTEYAEVSRA
jgi:transketolase N-terminal domain/subunit